MLREFRRVLTWGSVALVGLDAILVLQQSVDLGQRLVQWWA
jgi:hypothetical protein